jgi:hypothetical protein
MLVEGLIKKVILLAKQAHSTFILVHPLNTKRSRKIRKENMGEKVQRKNQHLKRKEKVVMIKNSAITIILGKEPVAMVPSVDLSTRIGLEEERAKEDSTTSSRS